MEWDYWFEMYKTITDVQLVLYGEDKYISRGIELLLQTDFQRGNLWKIALDKMWLGQVHTGLEGVLTVLPCEFAAILSLCSSFGSWMLAQSSLGCLINTCPNIAFSPVEVSFQQHHRHLFVGSGSYTSLKSLRVMSTDELMSTKNYFMES